MNALAETFHINNNINLYLLDAIKDENYKDVSASKGRNVGEQFAHMHNVRLMWLQAADPALMMGLEKIDKEKGISKPLLKKSLDASSKAIETLLENSAGKIKGFKPHATAFLGYLLAHEGHHRGQILLCLKQSGHMVDKKIQYGIWEWGSRMPGTFVSTGNRQLATKRAYIDFLEKGRAIIMGNPNNSMSLIFGSSLLLTSTLRTQMIY
jgi:uncharacterized damage-inducible protein DinB